MEPRIEIVNIVATLKLDPMPDPSEILEKIPGTRPLRRFRGALLRIGRIPVLFYKNKIVITGVKSTEELNSAVERLIEILRKRGVNANIINREIVNITAKLELGVNVDLREIAERLKGIYDPDYRPYMIAKINNTRVIVSQNGKIVLLGARNMEEVSSSINSVVKEIMQ